MYLDLVHEIIRGLITTDIKQHFSFAMQAPNSAVRTRGQRFKLEPARYRLNIAHNLFFNRVVSTWNGLPEHNVYTESFLGFKKALRTVLSMFNILPHSIDICNIISITLLFFVLVMFMHNSYI